MNYLTLAAPSRSAYTEKRSRFLGFALPVETAEQAKAEVKRIANEYHDARHACFAYMVGAERNEFLSSDNGEPSGTAGKPILGQINSFGLTNVLIVVVRYFGGIKLGTPGLIAAYRETARLAIEAGEIVERQQMDFLTHTFPYEEMNRVMKILKKAPAVKITAQTFDNICSVTLAVPSSDLEALRQLLENREP